MKSNHVSHNIKEERGCCVRLEDVTMCMYTPPENLHLAGVAAVVCLCLVPWVRETGCAGTTVFILTSLARKTE